MSNVIPTTSGEEVLVINFDYLNADASSYSNERLLRDARIQKYGLGALVGLMPIVIPPSVRPDVPANQNISNWGTWTVDRGNKPVRFIPTVIYDNKYFVVLNLVTEFGTRISPAVALGDFKKFGKHYGKFKKRADANAWVAFLKEKANAVTRIGSASQDAYNFGPFITKFDVSYTVDGASQVQFSVVDKDFRFMELNYFQARREFIYRGEVFEIGAVEVTQGESGSPVVNVTGWNAAVQKMKRDKKPENIAGSSVYEYAVNAANKYGLRFAGQRPNKHQSISKSTGNNVDENTWSVLTSGASQAEYLCFVADNTLFYASQKWLLWKYGTERTTTVKNGVTTVRNFQRLQYDVEDPNRTRNNLFMVLECPTIRQSENDPLEGDGNLLVARPNGCVLRAGQTALIGPKPSLFAGGYLITEVSFSEGVPDPIAVSFRKPQKTTAEKKAEAE